MSIVSVHGPNTFGSKAIQEVGPAQALPNPANGLIWTFRLDQPSTRTASLVWTFPTGTPATITGPGPHSVTFASAGSKAVTAVATGVGEGANPYPPAGTTNIPVNAVTGTGPPGTSLRSMPPEEVEEEIPSALDDSTPPEDAFAPAPSPGNAELPVEDAEVVDVGYDPAAHTVTEVEQYAEEHLDQAADLLAAEQAGKNRSTLVNFLEGLVPFEPGDYTVTQVISYVEDNPEELEDVIAAEEAGRNRTTLLTHLEGMRGA